MSLSFLYASSSGRLTVMADLQQEQPQLYHNLTNILNQEEQHIIQAVFHEADARALAAQESAAAAAAAAANAQANGGQ